MDHIISPKPIHQPAIITPRAPDYREKERKHHHDDPQDRSGTEKPEDQLDDDNTTTDEPNTIGSHIDIQI